MLETTISRLNYLFENENGFYFQQDGAPAHFHVNVRNFLDRTHNQRWIGRRGSAAEFPPRSADLTPPDFYLWGALKDTVYATKPQALEKLRVQIEHACNDIPLATIHRHHQVRSIIATALKHADYNTFEEVHGLSVTGSTRRIDIIAFKESTRSRYIIDPTERFETDEEQPAEKQEGRGRECENLVTQSALPFLALLNIRQTQRSNFDRNREGGSEQQFLFLLIELENLVSKNLKVRIYKTVILPVVLYGCETWTLTLKEEYRLRLYENKVLTKIFGAKRDEVTGGWRKLHNTELHALYSSPDIIRNIKSRRLRCAGHVARMGESRNAYRVLVGRPEGKRPLGSLRRRLEDNIKMDLREVGYYDRDWINLAQDRDRWWAYVRAAMNLRRHVPPDLWSSLCSNLSTHLQVNISYLRGDKIKFKQDRYSNFTPGALELVPVWKYGNQTSHSHGQGLLLWRQLNEDLARGVQLGVLRHFAESRIKYEGGSKST
ncbi:hypothetical protein ANN_14524 [Periplaneta americana]|uniref:Uncharacterized protein n=1 Tax=Periplaneta americana TaxID=6978 RepID=A0ABQ8SY12_PERAM|nr:hypothetical protein ANN_14524 [Periplaneta americana]